MNNLHILNINESIRWSSSGFAHENILCSVCAVFFIFSSVFVDNCWNTGCDIKLDLTTNADY